MKRLAFGIAVLFLATQVARSEPIKVYQHDQKVGKGKITVIEKLTPVNNFVAPRIQVDGDEQDERVDRVDARGVRPGMVTLCASDWQCGRCFSDERGRRWCLAEGSPVSEKPALMKGWIMQGESGQIFFLHESGSLYRRGVDRRVVNPGLIGD